MVLATENGIKIVMNVTDLVLYRALVNFTCEMRETICTGSSLDPIMIRLVVEEFCRNALHGDETVIVTMKLADGSWLLIARDIDGQDHLDPHYCGKRGREIIENIVGLENYVVQHNAHVWEAYMRIPA